MSATPLNLDLNAVNTLMQNLSRQSDPQAAALMYGQGIQDLGLVPEGGYISLSRRNLPAPKVRVTRSHLWSDDINPWKDAERLPVFDRGLLPQLIYANRPTIIEDLPAAMAPDDPAAAHFAGFKSLIALPHFENGESINMGVLLADDKTVPPLERVPLMLILSNLWGRATLNLVNAQKLRAAYDAMDHELKVVASIQRSLLPGDLPKIPGAEVAAHYQTSQRAGGDYYDFFPLPDDQWGILLADVSGHGIPAAVLMAITHAIAHMHPGHPMPPEQLLTVVNAQLARRYTVNNGTFVTALYGIFDSRTRRLTYSSAGHPAPRLLRDEKIIAEENESAFPLGVSSNERYPSITLQLEPEDHLLFYTDGIPDTFNPEGDSFGTDRLDAACIRRPCASSTELVAHIIEELRAFSQDGPVTDDRTLLALRMLP